MSLYLLQFNFTYNFRYKCEILHVQLDIKLQHKTGFTVRPVVKVDHGEILKFTYKAVWDNDYHKFELILLTSCSINCSISVEHANIPVTKFKFVGMAYYVIRSIR